MAGTDKLKKYKSLFSTTLSNSIGTGTGDTITLASVTGLPTDTDITITIDRVDSGNVAKPGKLERIKGRVVGNNLTDYTRGFDGSTEQSHSAGAVVEMIWNAGDLNDMVDWALVEHNQDGTHKSATVTTLKATGAEVNTGTEDAKIVTPKAIADSNVVLTTKTQTLTNKDLTASTNQMPTGVLGYAEATASQGSITTITDLTNLSVTVTVPTLSGRKVRIRGWIPQISSSVATDRADLTIRESTTVLSTAYGRAGVSSEGWGGASVEAILEPSAGSHTYKLSLARGAGTGNVGIFAHATSKAFILVELI